MNEEKINSENEKDLTGPPQIQIFELGLVAIGSLISGFVGSIVIILSIYFFLLRSKDLAGVYPFIYAITGFFATMLTTWINILMNRMINPSKYKRTTMTFMQIFLFYIFMFGFFLPIYVYATTVNPEYLVYVFSLYLILALLGASIFTEVISNYRYVLLGLYGNFMGSFIALLLTIIVLLTFDDSLKRLYILVGLLMLVNFSINTIRVIFEYAYYIYYNKTGMDQLGDIYYQIETEEKEEYERANKKNITFN